MEVIAASQIPANQATANITSHIVFLDIKQDVQIDRAS